jgi:hypothetical protein
VRVVASPEAVERVRESGGRLYVWPRRSRCCHGFTYLETGSSPKGPWTWQPVDADGFELYLAEVGRVPEELHVDVRGSRRRVEAYWDGCAWVT